MTAVDRLRDPRPCRSCGRRLSQRTFEALEDGNGCVFCDGKSGGGE